MGDTLLVCDSHENRGRDLSFLWRELINIIDVPLAGTFAGRLQLDLANDQRMLHRNPRETSTASLAAARAD